MTTAIRARAPLAVWVAVISLVLGGLFLPETKDRSLADDI